MDEEIGSDIAALAREIEVYLAAHPNAADTLSGIARWWLPRQRLEDAMHKIEQALCYLVAHGRVGAQRLGDGERIFIKRAVPPGDQLSATNAGDSVPSTSEGAIS